MEIQCERGKDLDGDTMQASEGIYEIRLTLQHNLSTDLSDSNERLSLTIFLYLEKIFTTVNSDTCTNAQLQVQKCH